MKAFFKDPLFHFLIAGVGLFAIYAAVAPAEEAEEEAAGIVRVDRAALVSYLQFGGLINKLASWQAEQLLDSIDQASLDKLVQDYVREEVIYRETVAAGMMEGDYDVRTRMVQKAQALFTDITPVDVEQSDADLRAFFDANPQLYVSQPRVSFTSIYFDDGRYGIQSVGGLAVQLLVKLNRVKVTADNVLDHVSSMDHQIMQMSAFPEDILIDYGQDLHDFLFKVKPDPALWRGPIRSYRGAHILLVTDRDPGGILPAFEDVREQVAADARQAVVERRVEENIRRAIGRYNVQVSIAASPDAGKATAADNAAPAEVE